MDNNEKLYEHLRTIHFGLIATTLILLVACSLAPVADLERAVEEAKLAAGLNASLTEGRVSRVFSQLASAIPPDAISIHEARGSLWWHVDDVYHPLIENVFPPLRPRLWIPTGSKAFSPPQSSPDALAESPEKRTIRQFKSTWEFLLNGKQAFVVTRLFPARATFKWAASADTRANASFHEEIVDHLADFGRLAPDRGFMTEVSVERNGNDGSFVGIFQINGGKTSDPQLRFGRQALIPLDTRRLPIELLPGLLKSIGPTGERIAEEDRTFESVFHNFDAYSHGLESLTFEELRSYLDHLRTEKGQDVELYGAKIPQRSISIWGIIIILVLQTYFLAHLKQLDHISTITYSQETYPWMPIYVDRLSRIMTILSLLLAPITCAALVWFGWRSLRSDVVRGCLVSGAFVSMVLAINIWLRVREYRKKGKLVFSES